MNQSFPRQDTGPLFVEPPLSPFRVVLAIAALVASVAAVTCGLAGCDKPGVLKPSAVAPIESVNAAVCPFWMPLATGLLTGKLGPFGPALVGALTCSAESAAVDALLAELVAHAPTPDAGAGLGVATGAIVASAGAERGLVPITRRDGHVVMLAPAAMAATCQAAQDRLDARAQ